MHAIRRAWLFAVCLLASGMWHVCAMGAQGETAAERVIVTSTGRAAAGLPDARDLAIEAALRRAVEAGAGLHVTGESAAEDFALVRDVVMLRAAGYIESYEVLQENPEDAGTYAVRIRAAVRRGEASGDYDRLRQLAARRGMPSMMIVRTVSREPFNERLAAEVADHLQQAGLRVVDAAMVDARRREALQEAARRGEDAAAGQLAGEVGADYLLVAAVQGMRYPPEDVYGVAMHRVEATGIIRIVEADTGREVAARLVETVVRSESEDAATRLASSRVIEGALREALAQLATHWWQAAAPHGGERIEVRINGVSRDAVEGIARRLRQRAGIYDATVEEQQAGGLARLAVRTHLTPQALAAVLSDMAPSIAIERTTAHQVVLQAARPPSLSDRRAWRRLAIVGIGVCGIVLALLAGYQVVRPRR